MGEYYYSFDFHIVNYSFYSFPFYYFSLFYQVMLNGREIENGNAINIVSFNMNEANETDGNTPIFHLVL